MKSFALVKPLSPLALVGVLAGALRTALLWSPIMSKTLFLILDWTVLAVVAVVLSFALARGKSYRRPVLVLAVFASLSLAWLFPETLGPGCGGEMPRALAGGGNQCERKWDCDNGCCRGGECLDSGDPRCGGGSPDSPPSISGQILCDEWGDNGWCVKNARLQLTASDPQGYSLTIEGVAGATPILCNGSCVVALPEGADTAKYTVTASGGKAASGSTAWKYDSVAPTVEYDIAGNLIGGWYANSPTVSASGADATSGIASVTILVDGTAESNPTSLGDGTHTVIVTAKDKAGLLSADQTVVVNVDTTQPIISASIPPAACGAWYASPISVDASASDAGSGVSSLSATLDGRTVQLPATVSGDGTHTLVVTSSDAVGNTATLTKTFNLDATPPALSIAKSGAVGQNGWNVSVTDAQIAASDATSGLQTVEYRVNGGAWTTGQTARFEDDGVYLVEARARDNACWTATQAETVRVDRTAPTVSFTTIPQIVNGNAVPVAGASADATSGMDRVEVSFDGGANWRPVGVDGAGNWSVAWDTLSLPNGVVAVKARAVDKAGNYSFASVVSLTVDNNGPVVKMDDRWPVDQLGWLQVIPNVAEVTSLTVTISGGGDKISWTYNSPPSAVAWDGGFGDKWAAPGDYKVAVVACDARGRCGAAEGVIEIAAVYAFVPIPTAVLPSPEPPRLIAVIQTAVPLPTTVAPTAAPQELPAPPVVETPKPVAVKTGASLLVAGLFAVLFVSQSLSDPRPSAIHALALALKKNIER